MSFGNRNADVNEHENAPDASAWQTYEAVIRQEVAKYLRKSALRRDAEREDLLQEGRLAALAALKLYDSNKGVPETAYVRIKVRLYLLQLQRRQDPLSETVRRDARLLDWGRSHARPFTSREIQAATQAGRIRRLTTKRLHEVTRQVTLSRDHLHEDALLDEEQTLFPTPEQWIITNEQRILLYRALKTLSTRERQILFMRYFDRMHVFEVANTLGISNGRVTQIAKQAIQKVRLHLEAG